MHRKIACLFLVFLIGCTKMGLIPEYRPFEEGAFTRYQGGYTEYQISENQFCVSYIGSGMDSMADNFASLAQQKPSKTKNQALRRASEITIQNGYRYFKINSEHFKTVPNGDGQRLHAITFMITCYSENPGDGAIDAYKKAVLKGV